MDYADDLCLLTHRLGDMKEKGERLQETGGRVGLKINIQKTKEMQAVERVSEFTYLGSMISETGGTDEDITARIRKAQSTFSMLMPVWKEKSDCKRSSGFSIQTRSLPFCMVRKHGDRRNY